MKLQEMLFSLIRNVSDKQQAIENKIDELESNKSRLQKQIEMNYDLQAEAELNGNSFDDTQIKKINTELVEIGGRIQAYKRQMSKPKEVPKENKDALLKQAASECREAMIQNKKTQISEIEMDKKIRKLIMDAKGITRIDPHSIIDKIEKSGLFENMDVANVIWKLVDINNDPEFCKLENEYKQLKAQHIPGYRYIWWDIK